MKKILTVLLVLLVVAGCSSTTVEQKTTTCTLESEVMTSNMEIVSEGDNVVKQITTNTTDFGSVGYSEEDIMTLVDTYTSLYGDIKGLTYDHEISDGTLKEVVTVDYKNGDMEEFLEKGVITTSEDGEVPEYVSLELTIESIESQGYTCE